MGNILEGERLLGAQAETERIVEETSIANRAMKAVLHRGVGAGRRVRDKSAEDAVKQQFGDEGQIVTRKLFADKASAIHKRNQLASEMYQYHMTMTLPHGDDGSRLLPNAVYFDYMQKMGEFERKLQVEDSYIIHNYAAIVAQDVAYRNAALMAQGKTNTVSAAEYPDVDTIKRYLYVSWHLEPIATAGDFRYQVDDTIRERLNARLVEMRQDVNIELMTRMLEPMKKFVEKLSVPIKEPGSVFRDSLVGNLNELVEVLPKLNINNDPTVSDLIDGIHAVIKPYVFAPDVLREVPEARSAARDKMAELMKKLDGYGLA
jgi:hypothetical protein